jgi:protein-L-isoaspartate(D-aspartate) O-methyltransferase
MHAIFMAALKLKKGDKVLEVGFGSGILLAYMREVVGKRGKVIGIEIVPEAFEFGKKNLAKAGYKDIKLVLGDGSLGLSEEAPFDKIISSASCPQIPKPWIEQLKPGGIIVSPVGPEGYQELVYLEKTKEGKIIRKNLGPVIFVRLTGRFGWKD